MKAVLVIVAALALSGCVATTKRLTEQQKKSAPFQVGRTTYLEVIDRLGTPAGSTREADGTRAINYFYSKSLPAVDSVIPHIGGFAGGSEVESSFVSMRFDKDGVLSHYSAMFGKTATGHVALSDWRP
jgi:hypothetical protein